MKCGGVDRLLSEGVPAEELRRRPGIGTHVAGCGRCSQLVAWAETPLAEPVLPEPVVDRIRTILHADLKPVRPLPPVWAALLGVFGLTAMTAALHALTMGASGWQALSPAQSLLLGGFSAAVLGSATVSLRASVRPASRHRLRPLVPILLLLAGFPIVAGLLFPAKPGDYTAMEGILCLADGLMVSAMAAGITYLIARQGYSTNWARSGALVGAVGGAAAIVALHITCAVHEFAHLAIWHGLIVLVSVSAGFLLGGRLRRTPPRSQYATG